MTAGFSARGGEKGAEEGEGDRRSGRRRGCLRPFCRPPGRATPQLPAGRRPRGAERREVAGEGRHCG